MGEVMEPADEPEHESEEEEEEMEVEGGEKVQVDAPADPNSPPPAVMLAMFSPKLCAPYATLEDMVARRGRATARSKVFVGADIIPVALTYGKAVRTAMLVGVAVTNAGPMRVLARRLMPGGPLIPPCSPCMASARPRLPSSTWRGPLPDGRWWHERDASEEAELAKGGTSGEQEGGIGYDDDDDDDDCTA
jgi:hypothetical protein